MPCGRVLQGAVFLALLLPAPLMPEGHAGLTESISPLTSLCNHRLIFFVGHVPATASGVLMGEQPLYDFAPLLELMGLGALIALVPLLWVWRRNRGAGPTRYLAALGVLTLFLTFDLVLFGAFTRLTDSGLGCPDWPGCYGSSSPIGALHHITAAETAMPTGPVTLSKAWIEMIHRYLATMVAR